LGGGGVCSVVEEHERAHSLVGRNGVGKTLFADVIFDAFPFFLFHKTKFHTLVGLGQTPSLSVFPTIFLSIFLFFIFSLI